MAAGVALAMLAGACAPTADITGSITPAASTPAPRAAAPGRSHPDMTPQALARAEAGFSACIAALEPVAAQRGVSSATFRSYARTLTPDMSIMEKLDTQPEFTRATGDYVEMLVAESRITKGREMLARHAATFAAVEQAYGVDRHVVAAIWGIETNYGAAAGRYAVIQATGTLACVGRRQPYFREEFVAALQIVDRGDIPAEHLNGSWAGAFGLTQFMPTAFQRDAVDFDGDGHRNVVDSIPDAMASTANKLRRGGWQAGRSWGYEVRLPRSFNYLLADKSIRKPLREWAALGVARPDARGFPRGDDLAYVLLPAGAKGPAFLMLDNFKAILSYNPADAYALAIGHLADRLRGGDAFVQAWPQGEKPLSRTERIELQHLLAARGYDVGTADGVLGGKTRVAIRDFQSRAGMLPDGQPSGEVLARMRP
ncbi:MAG TPA: lytic murein transglycosylase [Xanthobacteraceae bacterium]|nr:lytic murein transglycosylase [Xanthobacteraceae bacterium]